MEEKNKKRDSMPPPDATLEDIGEFWDTHSLVDYWDETHEVEFQVNLKSPQDMSQDEIGAVNRSNTLYGRTQLGKIKRTHSVNKT